MRRAGILLALVLLLASSAAPAAAHRFPALCASNNNAELTITSNRTTARQGNTISYTVTASNLGISPCDVTAATVKVRLPGPDGIPGDQTVTLVTDATLPAGQGPLPVGQADYVVAVNPGVSNIVAQVDAVGVLHDAPVDHAVTQNKTIGTVSTQPALSLAFTANPATGFAPLNVTYNYVLTNTSTTTVAMNAVTITHPSCTPINRVGGDTNGNNLLDNGEGWQYQCPKLFALPEQFSSGADGRATSTVDGQVVLAAPKTAVVTAQQPPRPVLTLSRSATPASGPAPLNVAHTYEVRNDSGPDARPVKNIAIDDAVCAPVSRTAGDDALQRGETWTYTCGATLATAQTVSGTAVANGVDDLEGISVSSNLASIEVTATGVSPAPTSTPTPTPEPTSPPEPTAAPTPRPSARVSFATTSGRFARPCGKTATAQLKVGRRIIATKRVKLDSRCRYRVRFTNVSRSQLRGATRVSVTVRSGLRTATRRVAVPKR